MDNTRAGTADDRIEYDEELAGRRVRHAREDLGWSAGHMAEILTRRTPVAWSIHMVRNLESGRKTIDPPLLRILAEVLVRPVEYFLYQDPYNTAGQKGATVNAHNPRSVVRLLHGVDRPTDNRPPSREAA